MNSKLERLEKEANDTFDFGKILLSIIVDLTTNSMDSLNEPNKSYENLEKDFVQIKENLKSINRNYDAIREIDSKVNKNLNAFLAMFERTEKLLKLMQISLKNELDAFKKFTETSKIEIMTNEIASLIEQFIDKKISIRGLSDEEYVTFLESPNGLSSLKSSKEVLLKNMKTLIENSSTLVMPENADDEIGIKSIQLLLIGLKAYFEINFDLINAYRFMAKHYHELNQIDKSNNYTSTLASSIRILENEGQGLFENSNNIFYDVKDKAFILSERADLVYYLNEKEMQIDGLKIKLNEFKKLAKFIEDKPITKIQYDFSRSNVSTPFRGWVDHQKVSYALQYKDGTDLSLISEWSDSYEIYQKGCPYLILDDNYTGDLERIIFRKFSNDKPELVATIKNKDQKEFRDIDRDLFNSVVLEANEELAIRDLNFLIKNGANINTTFEDQKSLVHYVCKKSPQKSNLLLELIKNNSSIDLSDKDGRRPLHIATENNSKEIVQILLDHGADVNAKTNLKWTPIHYAFKTGNEEIVSLLINKGSNVTLTTENDFNVFHIATSSGKVNMINLDKIKGVDINAKSSKGLNVLHLSVIGEHTSLIELLLNNSQVDVNAESEGKLSALHLSALSGNVDVIKQLLKHKDTNVNQLTEEGYCALNLAIALQKEEVALELLNLKDIDVNSEGKSKLSAIHLATMKNMTKVVSRLIEKKARVGKCDVNGNTPLHVASSQNNKEIVNLLVNDGKSNVNARDKEGNTPLMLTNQIEIAKFLTENGSRLEDENEKGFTAFELSSSRGNKEIFSYLKEKSPQKLDFLIDESLKKALDLAIAANQIGMVKKILENDKSFLYQIDSKGNTVLHHAVGNLEMMKFLLDQDVNYNLNARNYDGDTVLNIASSNHQNYQMVRFLISKEVDLNQRNYEHYTPILKAGNLKNWPIVKLLISKRADPYWLNLDRNSLLMYACRDSDLEMVGYLIAVNFKVDELNEYGWSSLSFSVRNGHFQLTKYLIDDENANYNLIDKSGFSILHLAVESGNLELVRYFVEQKGLNVNSPANTTSCLHLSAKHNHLEVLKYLLTKRSNIDSIDENGNTPLLIAGKSRNWDIVEHLIKQNANTELLDKERNSIIHEIATSDRVDLIKLLKNKRIIRLTKAKNSQGKTALHNSALSPDSTLKMLQYLMEDLKFIFDQDNLGNNPAHYSASINDLEAIVYLDGKFFIDQPNKNGKTPCTLSEDLRISKFLIEKNTTHSYDAFENSDNLGVLKYLIEIKNYDLYKKDQNGKNILIHAAEKGAFNVVQYLVSDLGMDINREDIVGNNATFYADQNNHQEILFYLDSMNNKEIPLAKYSDIYQAIDNQDVEGVAYFIRFKHVDPNLKDPYNLDSSLLHYSSDKSLEIVKYLVSKSADVYARDSDNNLPLFFSCNKSKMDLVQFYILDQKMSTESKGRKDYTCLLLSSYNGDYPLTVWLVEHGADLRAKIKCGSTALDLAIEYGRSKKLIEYLKSHMPKFGSNRVNQKTNYKKIDKLSEIDSTMIYKLDSSKIGNRLEMEEKNLDLQDFDLNQLQLQSTLMLFNVLIRKLTNKKFVTNNRHLSLIEAKAIALNIAYSLEKRLKKMSDKFAISIEEIENFDGTSLISTLAWHLRNGEFEQIPKMLSAYVEKYCLSSNIVKDELQNHLENHLKKILIKELIQSKKMKLTKKTKRV